MRDPFKSWETPAPKKQPRLVWRRTSRGPQVLINGKWRNQPNHPGGVDPKVEARLAKEIERNA